MAFIPIRIAGLPFDGRNRPRPLDISPRLERIRVRLVAEQAGAGSRSQVEGAAMAESESHNFLRAERADKAPPTDAHGKCALH
jgi:hypothetical protein